MHAFTDDALGTHDAVGLVAALHAGDVSVPEVVEAAIARAERVQPELNGIAFAAYDRARAEARDPRPGFFAGVPTWVKDNVLVAGMPTMEGTDAWDPVPAKADGDFARMHLATGLLPLGKSQLSEYGFLPSAEHPRLGAVRCPWDLDRTAGASSAGSSAMVAAGRGADRARQRRRRQHPDPGQRQRAGRAEADPRPLRAGRLDAADAGADRLRRRGHPQRPRHRGLGARGREGLPRAARCRRSAT